jgi:hypothetical protein
MTAPLYVWLTDPITSAADTVVRRHNEAANRAEQPWTAAAHRVAAAAVREFARELVVELETSAVAEFGHPGDGVPE